MGTKCTHGIPGRAQTPTVRYCTVLSNPHSILCQQRQWMLMNGTVTDTVTVTVTFSMELQKLQLQQLPLLVLILE
jgi:hypothetical protein